MESLPPGEHRLSLVCLRFEVHHIHILVLQEAQPYGLSVVAQYHASVLPRTGLLGPVLRSDEDIAGSSIARLHGHLDDRRGGIPTRGGVPFPSPPGGSGGPPGGGG